MKVSQIIFLLFCLFQVAPIFGQIYEGNGYLIGEGVEVAVDGDGGHEGTADWPGHHSRGGSDDVPFGFVANPTFDGWVDYDGDFFTAGTPENGFGIEINGTNYSNNGWNSGTLSAYLQQIPKAPGTTITHTIDGECITVEWEGLVAGVLINVKYHLISYELFYTTEITLTNTTGSDLSDVYYYRNVDPDNNQPLTGSFETTNTIASQPSPDCIKALVSAEQASPSPSYLGIGALGEAFRVSHGGFSNRSGSDIWNGTGLSATLGDVETADEAVSLAYKTAIGAGETVNFTYAVVLDEEAVEAAFSSLYFITYEAPGDIGGGVISPCSPAIVEVNSCNGNDVELVINGPDIDGYTWTWYPGFLEGDTVVVSPGFESSFVVVGEPIAECLVGLITKTVNIEFTVGPSIEIIDPGPICGEFDLTTLTYYDLDEGENTNCIFLSEQPDSATQVEPIFEGPFMDSSDDVWLMCGDSVTGCFTYVKLDLDFVGPGAAGPDSTINICGGPGTTIFLINMLVDSANLFGYYEDITEIDGFDSTGVFNASGLFGTFEFMYIVEGVGECPSDTSLLTVIIDPGPSAYFTYEVDGFSSADGLQSTCIYNTVQFFDGSFVPDPGVITNFTWIFDETDTIFDVPNPTYDFETVGSHNIRLIVYTENGCFHIYGQSILIYEEPDVEIVFNTPLCNGSEDGVITVEIDIIGAVFNTEITNEAGEVLNAPGTQTVTGVGAGTYYINVSDEWGCGTMDTIVLTEPPFMDIWYRLYHPPCMGDSGYVVVDSVAGESLNNPMSYEWDPNPSGVGGVGADSAYWMVAGTYTLTVTDSRGCSNQIEFTMIDPPLFYFTDWGWDTAYCRIFGYQSGNGVVYAAAAGGVSPYVYDWTYLYDGSSSNTTTWGGRNPGEHLITVTDAFGCELTKIIEVDSVNPIASFNTVSSDMDELCRGTADISAEFINTSQYYANPNNPDADTLFRWDLFRDAEEDWMVSRDWYETFDTIYKAIGVSYDAEICLIAYNKNGCSDTACKVITVWEPPIFDAPNVFTPNGDGENDVFTFEFLIKGIKNVNCVIVNRWGVTMAEMEGPSSAWDGTDQQGDPCSDGVYYYIYTAEADNGERYSGQGTVTLLTAGY